MSDQYVIPSLKRAVQVLEVLARDGGRVSLADLSRSTDIPKSTLFRILATLQKEQCVVSDEASKTYRLGPKLWELGNAYVSQLDFYGAAIPAMRDLADACGESVFLGILTEGEVVYVRQMVSPDAVTVVNKLGQRAPVYCTATGEAILAFLPEQEAISILEKQEILAYNPKTNTDLSDLEARLDQIRQNGVAVVDGEYNAELLCISSPILDKTQTACAAITVAMLSATARIKRVQEVSALVRETAARISRQLGYLGNGVAGFTNLTF